MWMLDGEKMVREITRDEGLKGHQNFNFEACLEDEGQVCLWRRGKRRGLISDWSNQVISWCNRLSHVITDLTVFRVGDGTVPLAIVIYIDSSFIKHSIPVNAIYITVQNLYC